LKGIKAGSLNGIEQAATAFKTRPNTMSPIVGALKGGKTAITATASEKHKTNLLEGVLFVSGLFDNVLLPFNWLDDHSEQKKQMLKALSESPLLKRFPLLANSLGNK